MGGFLLHPKFADSQTAIKTEILSVLDSQFRSQYGTGMAAGLTEHQNRAMDALAETKAIEILHGYVRITKDYRKVLDMRRKNKKRIARRSITHLKNA